MRPSVWAEKYRVVGEDSGSPFPGPWSNDLLPYLVMLMDRLARNDPAQLLTIRGSAQTGKSEVALNGLLCMIDQAPKSFMALLPSGDEAVKYEKIKFDATVRASPRLRLKVLPKSARSGENSTGAFKRFHGGFGVIGNANSSKTLQMTSIGFLIAEELEEYEEDVGGRGNPFDQGFKRGTMYGPDFKAVIASTTGMKGTCKTTEKFERGDQCWLYVPCPHCGDWQAFKFENMVGPVPRPSNWREGDADLSGESVGFYCKTDGEAQPNKGCGAKIESYQRRELIDAGRWVACFPSDDPKNPTPPDIIPADEIDRWAYYLDLAADRWLSARDTEGRQPSVHIWQAMNKVIDWSVIWKEWREVCRGERDAKVFFQQTLGLPYEGLVDRPEVAALVEAAGKVWQDAHAVPPFCAFLTMAVDVQIDRLEWAVYAWGRGGVGVRIAKGKLPGDPTKLQVWKDLDAQRAQTYAGPAFKPATPRRCFVDSGNWTQEVYRYCRRRGAEGVFAIFGAKGAKQHEAPAVTQGTLRKVKFRGKVISKIAPLQIGGHTLKGRFMGGMADGLTAEKGKPLPSRAILFAGDLDEDEAKQLTAERLDFDDPKKPYGAWVKVAGQANEALDLGVYNLGAAISLQMDNWDADRWANEYAEAMPATDPALIYAGGLEQLWHQTAAPAPAEDDAKPQGLTDEEKARLAEMGKRARGEI